MNSHNEQALDYFVVHDKWGRAQIFNSHRDPILFEAYRDGNGFDGPVLPEHKEKMARWENSYALSRITIEPQLGVNLNQISYGQMLIIKEQYGHKLSRHGSEILQSYIESAAQYLECRPQLPCQREQEQKWINNVTFIGERHPTRSMEALSAHYMKVDYFISQKQDPVTAFDREQSSYMRKVREQALGFSRVQYRSEDPEAGARFVNRHSFPELLADARRYCLEESIRGGLMPSHCYRVAAEAVSMWLSEHEHDRGDPRRGVELYDAIRDAKTSPERTWFDHISGKDEREALADIYAANRPEALPVWYGSADISGDSKAVLDRIAADNRYELLHYDHSKLSRQFPDAVVALNHRGAFVCSQRTPEANLEMVSNMVRDEDAYLRQQDWDKLQGWLKTKQQDRQPHYAMPEPKLPGLIREVRLFKERNR
jgi:hypothetical protein